MFPSFLSPARAINHKRYAVSGARPIANLRIGQAWRECGDLLRRQRTVSGRCEIPVCVGISTTKTLAKVANRTAKKDPLSGGVCYLPDEASQTAALAKMELGDVWGIGRGLAPPLAALSITSPLKLRDANPTRIRERFNVVLQRTVMELQGTPCLDLEQDSPDSKTICCSRSFARAVEGFDELAEALTAYTSYAAQKMRAGPGNRRRGGDAHHQPAQAGGRPVIRNPARAADDRHQRHRPVDPRGPMGPRAAGRIAPGNCGRSTFHSGTRRGGASCYEFRLI